MKDDRTQAIAARAYELWERAGRPRGQHEAHWRQAEREIGEPPTPDDATVETAKTSSDGPKPGGEAVTKGAAVKSR